MGDENRLKDVVIITVLASESDVQHYFKCLNSVLKFPPECEIDIWVVDNTKKNEGVDEIVEKNPEVHVLRNEKIAGFSENNNAAIKATESKYVFLLNPDTIIDKGSVDRFYEYMENDADAAVVSCLHVDERGIPYGSSNSFPSAFSIFIQMLRIKRLVPNSFIRIMANWKWTRILGKSIRTHLDNFNERGDGIREVDWVGGAAMFVRRNLLEKVGLLDEKFFLYFEDIDWCYRFKMQGYKIIHIAGQTLTHISGEKRDLPESEMATKEKIKSVLWYFTKNRGSAYSLIVRILSIVALSIRLLFEIVIAPFQGQKGKIKTTLIMLKVFIGIN